MQHGQLGHFLVYHLLPVVLIYGGMLGLIALLTYLHKSKKRNQTRADKKTRDNKLSVRD
ncbi:MAG: hypothetical protein AB1477_05105 [Acidobacteriota bacterium]